MSFSAHPIQLRFVGVRELMIQTFWPPTIETPIPVKELTISFGMSEFEADRKTLQVALMGSMGINHEPTREESAAMKERGDLPFRLKVHLVGEFSVDTTKFPVEKVEAWGKANARYTLMPFLREHVFALTARVGYRPLILPLATIPTFKVEAPAAPAVVEAPATPVE